MQMNVTAVLTRPSVLANRRESEIPLLEAARAMNKDALVKIFDLYSHALYNYALRLCNDSLIADYVVGDVFAKLLEQFSMGSGPNNNLRSYLYETAYHLIVDEARYSNRQAPLEVLDLAPLDRVSASTILENRVLLKTIMLAIRNNLTRDQRHVVILRFLEGFSLLETAAIVGKEVSHVKVIQNRAISALRKVLETQTRLVR
jgi:RNA polymerase sigma-70 factor (ECF subfamily)